MCCYMYHICSYTYHICSYTYHICSYTYHICSYMFCYSSSCPSSPPFSVHHFARSPSDTHISGGGFVTYTKSSPFEVRNELFFNINFREFPCLLHKLPKQINTTVISLILFGSCLVRNPLRDPSVLNDFFLDTFSLPSTLTVWRLTTHIWVVPHR